MQKTLNKLEEDRKMLSERITQVRRRGGGGQPVLVFSPFSRVRRLMLLVFSPFRVCGG